MSAHTFEIIYEEFDSTDELPEDERCLVLLAWEAREKANAVYSRFQVGSAILTQDGRVVSGSNQENANYKGSCAERVALDSAGAQGLKTQVQKIAIVGAPSSLDLKGEPLGSEEPVAPCGQCRQDIKEVEDMSGGPIVIIMASRTKVRRMVGVNNLLPFAFGPSDLGITF